MHQNIYISRNIISSTRKNPILFIPGLAASPLYWKNTSNSAWKQLWVPWDLLSIKGFGNTRLWKKRVAMKYIKETDTFVEKDTNIETTAWRSPNYVDNEFCLTDDVGGLSGCTELLSGKNINDTRGFRFCIQYFQQLNYIPECKNHIYIF